MKTEYTKMLDLIENDFLKETTQKFIKEKVPDYFFEIPASSSGKYHPSFDNTQCGLIKHSIMVVEVIKELLRLEKYSLVNPDNAIIAGLLHDTFKNGYTDCKHTVSAHPEIAAVEFKNFALKCLDKNIDRDIHEYYTMQIFNISDTIKTHMGDWGDIKPETPLEELVFMADYIASRKFFDKYPNEFAKECTKEYK